MNMIHIKPATGADLPAISHLLITSLDPPAAHWLHAGRSLTILHTALTHTLASLLPHGSADIATAPDGTPLAAAVWICHGSGLPTSPPGTATPPETALTAEDAGNALARHFCQLLSSSRLHEPHHHLAALAVTPTQRGQGLGSHLLTTRLKDTPAHPTLATTHSRSTRRFLHHHGFTDLPLLPTSGPPLWRLHR